MGQSATLYRIAAIDFPKVVANPDDFGHFNIIKASSTFQQTHEGLRFLLLKNQNTENRSLVEHIFIGGSHIGDLKAYEEINFTNLPDNFDFTAYDMAVSSIISYNAPDMVKAIAELLESISVPKFRSLFDYEELNRKGIYPQNVWNDKMDDNKAFNVGDMTEEFLNLRDFFEAAATDGDYMITFVE